MRVRVPSLTALLLCLSGCTFKLLEPPPPPKKSQPPGGPPPDKAGLEQEKTRIQGELIAKAQAIYQAAKEQIGAYKDDDPDCAMVAQQGIGLMTTLPISVLLPQGFTFNELSQ
jgi:hypothetical protein